MYVWWRKSYWSVCVFLVVIFFRYKKLKLKQKLNEDLFGLILFLAIFIVSFVWLFTTTTKNTHFCVCIKILWKQKNVFEHFDQNFDCWFIKMSFFDIKCFIYLFICIWFRVDIRTFISELSFCDKMNLIIGEDQTNIVFAILLFRLESTIPRMFVFF